MSGKIKVTHYLSGNLNPRWIPEGCPIVWTETRTVTFIATLLWWGKKKEHKTIQKIIKTSF